MTGGNRHDVTQLLPLLDALAARSVAGKIGRLRAKLDRLHANRRCHFQKHRRLLRGASSR